MLRQLGLTRGGNGRMVEMIDLDYELGKLEHSIITFMSLAAARLDDNSLVLIDEPEINLHPEWQARYLDC